MVIIFKSNGIIILCVFYVVVKQRWRTRAFYLWVWAGPRNHQPGDEFTLSKTSLFSYCLRHFKSTRKCTWQQQFFFWYQAQLSNHSKVNLIFGVKIQSIFKNLPCRFSNKVQKSCKGMFSGQFCCSLQWGYRQIWMRNFSWKRFLSETQSMANSDKSSGSIQMVANVSKKMRW